MRKERIWGLDFARVMCTLGIIGYHFSADTTGVNFLYKTQNFGTGMVFVCAFFMLSGAVLYYNHPKVTSLKKFYYKRWLSIYPAFYICYFAFFAVLATKSLLGKSTFLFDSAPWTFILTLLGLDGYLMVPVPNFYIIGEWFLGAIVIMYVLYPAAAKAIETASGEIIFTLTVAAVFALSLGGTPLTRLGLHSIVYCFGSFYVGILLIKHRKFLLDNPAVGAASAVGTYFFLSRFIKPVLNGGILNMLAGLALLITLYFIGSFVMKVEIIKKPIVFMSNISFEVFLVHHRVIGIVHKLCNPQNTGLQFALLLATIAISVILAELLSITAKKTVQWVKLKFEH